jgi:hypothetical protein
MFSLSLCRTACLSGLLLFLGVATTYAQRTALQQRLTTATSVSCTFPLVSTGTWNKGVPEATSAPAKLNVTFVNVNVDEGTADQQSSFGESFIVVRQANDYLHFMQMYASGPLHTTTILAREGKDGRLMAVHTRHEYTDVAIPGFTSRPEMYVGDCEVK